MLLPLLNKMLRQLKVLALLPSAFVLAGDGQLSMCNVLTLCGLQPHHHLANGATTSCCVQDCAHHDAPEAAPDEAPCPEDCLLELPSIEVVVAQVLILGAQPARLPWAKPVLGASTGQNACAPLRNRTPPGLIRPATSPPATGRFLL